MRDKHAPIEVAVDQVFAPLDVTDATKRESGRWKFAEVELDLSQKPGTSSDVTVGLGIGDTLWDGQPFPWMTMGPMKIDLSRRDVAQITITLPVKLTAKATNGG